MRANAYVDKKEKGEEEKNGWIFPLAGFVIAEYDVNWLVTFPI